MTASTTSRTGTRRRILTRPIRAISSLRSRGRTKRGFTMYNSRVTVRDADGRAEKRWLQNDSEYENVLRREFGLNMSDQEIDQCVATMKAKGTGDAPHPFFA